MPDLTTTSLVALSMLSAPLRHVVEGLPCANDRPHCEQIGNAIRSSPELVRQMSAIAADGRLSAITILPAGAQKIDRGVRFRAWHDGTTINLASDLLDELASPVRQLHTLDYTRNNPDDLVFVLGFITARMTSQSTLQSRQNALLSEFKKNVAAASAGTPPDATQFVKQTIDLQIENDARAYITGWNDVFDAAKRSTPQPSVKDMAVLELKMRYSVPLAKAMSQPDDRIVTPPTFHFALDEHNIHAVSTALRSSPVADLY